MILSQQLTLKCSEHKIVLDVYSNNFLRHFCKIACQFVRVQPCASHYVLSGYKCNCICCRSFVASLLMVIFRDKMDYTTE